MSARKASREGARKRPAFPKMTAADRLRQLDHLHAGAVVTTRLIQALDGLLWDAIDASEAKRADAALIAWAAFSRLKVETGAVLFQAANLHNDARTIVRGGAK